MSYIMQFLCNVLVDTLLQYAVLVCWTS